MSLRAFCFRQTRFTDATPGAGEELYVKHVVNARGGSDEE